MQTDKLKYWLISIVLIVLCNPTSAEERIKGLVVDHSDGYIWIGIPESVRIGAVFDIRLMPGSDIMALAEVVEVFPGKPHIARATYEMEDPDAFIPVGAYAETSNEFVETRDRWPGYRAVTVKPREPHRLSLHVGALFPRDSELRDETQSVWPSVELSYRLSGISSMDAGITAGYFGQRGSFQINGIAANRNVNVYPLTFDARIRVANGEKLGWYSRLSVGGFFVNDRITVGAITDRARSVEFGWRAGFGYVSRSGRFAELHYVDVSGTDFQGVVLNLGARF